ncbi:protein of unknown function [uncultured Woeseiaceae bacterium]|uniref:Uncharacterized protein n=1 Tax=uncultured Woeseiaceae bacterium TaxID=1983305 RepID=A0A7D9H559_9GAMM|nr:protein of unknown function [uncultured Woeseiaceae bacterium]
MSWDGTHLSKKRPVSASASNPRSGHACGMLTEIYIEALLVDEGLADQVWEAWNKGEIDDWVAWFAWLLITSSNLKILCYAK